MIKVFSPSLSGMSALISDATNKAACEAEITAGMTEHLGGASASFMYSKGVPFVLLRQDQRDQLIQAGIAKVGEKEAAQIQAAFVAG